MKTTSAQRRSQVTPIQKMARKATEEKKAADLKHKVQTGKKSLEGQQHTADEIQQFQATEEASAIAAKEAVESKGREARVETSREGGSSERGQSSTTNKAEGWSQDHRRGREREWTNSQFSERRLQTACRMNSLSSRVN